MFNKHIRNNVTTTMAGMVIVWSLGLSAAAAQPRGRWQPLPVIEAGTRVTVRTSRAIDERNLSGRVFTGVVDQDVSDSRGRLAIPRGAAVELIVRRGANRELFLDLESIHMNNQWYGVDATQRAIRSDTRVDSTIGNNQETAQRVGGGAIIGSIIGAIVGGGKGAAIGAVAGAGVGASTQLQVHGEYVRVPAESLVTFRLESPLTIGWKDAGSNRGGSHYHQENDYQQNDYQQNDYQR
jgi:hypothetical protein